MGRQASGKEAARRGTTRGRYLTVAISTAVQAAGIAVLTISTAAPGLRPPRCADPTGDGRDPGCLPPSGTQLAMLYLGLYLTALGIGGLKSSVSAFGSDQFDESQAGERLRMPRFFGCFFFFNSMGSLRACVRAGQRASSAASTSSPCFCMCRTTWARLL